MRFALTASTKSQETGGQLKRQGPSDRSEPSDRSNTLHLKDHEIHETHEKKSKRNFSLSPFVFFVYFVVKKNGITS